MYTVKFSRFSEFIICSFHVKLGHDCTDLHLMCFLMFCTLNIVQSYNDLVLISSILYSQRYSDILLHVYSMPVLCTYLVPVDKFN